MKKVFAIFAAAAVMFAVSACGNNKKAENKEAETAPATELTAPAQEETVQEPAGEPAAETANAEVTK